MDTDTLKENLKTAIKIMPPEIQLDVGQLFHIVIKHVDAIAKVGPQLHALLGNDINTLAFEFATGTLDRERLDAAVKSAFAECGIVLPEISAPVPKG
jgi:hypothetical protein